MSKGQNKTFTILFDRKEVKGQIAYLGKETISTAIGKKECYKLAIGSSQTDVLQGKNNNFLWLTADENKILVYGKFKIPVAMENLKLNLQQDLKIKMKKALTILAMTTSILAIILSVLPVSNLSIIPAIAALIFGLGAFYLSKRSGQIKKDYSVFFLTNHYSFGNNNLQSPF